MVQSENLGSTGTSIVSQLLFSLFLEFIMTNLKTCQVFNLENNLTIDIKHADDTTIFSSSYY